VGVAAGQMKQGGAADVRRTRVQDDPFALEDQVLTMKGVALLDRRGGPGAEDLNGCGQADAGIRGDGQNLDGVDDVNAATGTAGDEDARDLGVRLKQRDD